MFTQEERNIMERDFFVMNIMTDSLYEFQSQNKDWWIIMEVEVYQTKKQIQAGVPKQHVYNLYHKHAGAKGYHEHGSRQYASVLDCVLEVINHDDYRQKRKGRTHFEELLEEVRMQQLFNGIHASAV